MDEKKDKGLQGNEKIEEAILALQQEPQRISSVQDADRIIVMEGGRIAQIGNHDELLKKIGRASCRERV